jgi:DNA polymerase-3 subunit epsilon
MLPYSHYHPAHRVVVLDFETSGLSPAQGARAIEIGAVRLVNGKIAERFQSLMNPGFRISALIEDYTGISNRMLARAPGCTEVMRQFAAFIGSDNLVAHNASFDQRFLSAELERLNLPLPNAFTCNLMLARRVFPEARSHKLADLVAHCHLTPQGNFHRALADAEMTAQIWLQLLAQLANQYPNIQWSFALIQRVNQTPRKQLTSMLNGTRGS